MTGRQRYTSPKRKRDVKVRAMTTKDVQTQQVGKCGGDEHNAFW